MKDYSYRVRLEKLGLTKLIKFQSDQLIFLSNKEKWVDLIEIFKIINRISNHSRHFLIFLLEWKIYYQDRFQKLSLLANWIFLLIKYDIFGTNCLIRSKQQ